MPSHLSLVRRMNGLTRSHYAYPKAMAIAHAFFRVLHVLYSGDEKQLLVKNFGQLVLVDLHVKHVKNSNLHMFNGEDILKFELEFWRESSQSVTELSRVGINGSGRLGDCGSTKEPQG